MAVERGRTPRRARRLSSGAAKAAARRCRRSRRPAAIAAARAFLAGRAGRTSFAVIDSAGHLSGLRPREHFESASVVKVMFLTAYLQMLQAHHRALSARTARCCTR